MRARDGERAERPSVSRDEAAEGRISGGVGLSPVRHRESHARRRIESHRGALGDVCERGAERDPDLSDPLVWPSWRKQVHGERSDHGGDGCAEQPGDPPAEESPPGWRLGFVHVRAHCVDTYEPYYTRA